MTDESAENGGYRHPDGHLRTRTVTLPTPRDEARRARGLFFLAVGVATTVLTPTGVAVTHGAQLFAGQAVEPMALLRTAGWFLGATLLFIVPFAAIGLYRELRRYRRVRAAIGERALLDANGTLRSEDGSRTWSLR